MLNYDNDLAKEDEIVTKNMRQMIAVKSPVGWNFPTSTTFASALSLSTSEFDRFFCSAESSISYQIWHLWTYYGKETARTRHTIKKGDVKSRPM